MRKFIFKIFSISIIFTILTSTSTSAYQKTLGLTDKEIVERLTRLEQGQKDLNKRFDDLIKNIDKRFEQVDKRFEQIDKRFEQIDKRFEQINKRLDDFISFLTAIVTVFGGLVIALMGLVFWDRKTIIKASKYETIKEIEKEGSLASLIKALKDLSKDDKKLARVLKEYNII